MLRCHPQDRSPPRGHGPRGRGRDYDRADKRSGIHLLDPGTVRSDGVRFIGATLWTDLVLEGTADEIGGHLRVSREISDFLGEIQYQGRDFTTGESVERHRADRAFIEREIEEAERIGDRAVASGTTPRAGGRSGPGSKAIRSTVPSHPTSTA